MTLIQTVDDVDVKGDEAMFLIASENAATQMPGTVMTGGKKAFVTGFPVSSLGNHLKFLQRGHSFEHLDTILCLLSVHEYAIRLSLGREFHAITIIR